MLLTPVHCSGGLSQKKIRIHLEKKILSKNKHTGLRFDLKVIPQAEWIDAPVK